MGGLEGGEDVHSDGRLTVVSALSPGWSVMKEFSVRSFVVYAAITPRYGTGVPGGLLVLCVR